MTCTVDGCDKPVHRRGLCSKHMKRMQRWGTTVDPPKPGVCSVDGCDKPARTKGKCGLHYQRDWRARPRPGVLLVVACGDCGQRLGTIPAGGSPWAAIDAHHCNRRTA